MSAPGVAQLDAGPRSPAPSHTPGPLVAEAEQDWWNVKVVGSDRAETDSETATAEYTAGYCTEGDARLYAAAPELLLQVELLERSLLYEIRKAARGGDIEGAHLKTYTLYTVMEVLAKAKGLPPPTPEDAIAKATRNTTPSGGSEAVQLGNSGTNQ